MSANLVALVAGTVLAVGALAFVLYPLFFTVTEREARQDATHGPADDSAILALREIEFDRATGKLSESDYAELKTTYSARALAELRGATPAPKTEPTTPLDPVEARVRAYRLTHRECPTCGLRPEPDAIYCSTCGCYLARECPSCGAGITETSATYCSTCGATLARARPAAFV